VPAQPPSTDTGFPSKQRYCQHSPLLLGKGGDFGVNYIGKKVSVQRCYVLTGTRSCLHTRSALYKYIGNAACVYA